MKKTKGLAIINDQIQMTYKAGDFIGVRDPYWWEYAWYWKDVKKLLLTSLSFIKNENDYMSSCSYTSSGAKERVIKVNFPNDVQLPVNIDLSTHQK